MQASAERSTTVPTVDPDAVIVAHDLVRTFDARRAVDGLSLSVARGECLGLLGPNGAGKTTTIRILSTQTAPTSGSVRIFGADPRRDPELVRSRIGVVPQETALYDGLTAAENLRFFGRLQGLSGARLSQRVEWALETAGLVDRSAERVERYSGGMKRRLNIVAALLHEPELVFFDEPTLGVDPQSRTHVLELIEALHAAGATVVYTTHQLGEVERLCDRIVILDHGRAIARGTLDELAAGQRSRSRWLRVEPDGRMEELVALLDAERAHWTIEEDRPSLEQIFLSLTGRALRDVS